MSTTRIVELFIDDEFDESGIEAISLVSRPAHDETWLAFKAEEVEKLDSPYTIASEDFCSHNPQLDELGEPYSKLLKEGYRVVRLDKITPMEVHRMQQERFSNPNAESVLDSGNYLIRYKYIGPRDDKNRKFCADMMAKNRVYRIEDIEALSNPEFGTYSIFMYRGSYNCRHAWVRLLYAKEDSPIRNSGSSTKGLKDETVVVGLDTRNDATVLNPSPDSWEPGRARDGSIFAPEYSFAEKKGLEDACWEGYEAIGTKIVDGREVPNCVPIKMTKDDFADSISDYPDGVKQAAQRAVRHAEKNGWGSCGTGVGKQRASQLAKGEKISVDTIKRMYSYLSRHKGDLTSSKTYEDGCGKLMYDAWGGEAGLKWSERKLAQLEKMSKTPKGLSLSEIERWGGVKADGRKLMFYDDEKKVIVGAAMVPNRMIHRYDSMGNLYYVFFSKASIRKMAEKFMRQKRTDETNIEHDGKKLGADKVFVTESWVSEDPERDKSASYGFNLPAGTWYVSMKVEDPKVWKMIKSKELTGFSVEGLFAEKSVFSKEDKTINQIKQILKSINDD
jgi:hypothetical protein